VSEPYDAPRPGAGDLRAAVLVAVALAVAGALLGLLWAAWSPPRPAAEVLGGGSFAVLDETESAIAGDGRFLILTVALGLVAALLAWFVLPARRGATLLLGLCVGVGVGGLLMELVGHLTGGGSFTGRRYLLTDGTRREITLHLPLSLHEQGLLLVGPAVVALVYGLFVAFAVRDDLGRPDDVRDRLRAAAAPPQPFGDPRSVRAGDYPQYGGGYGDAPGALQQRDLPPQ
jgi:hypothetical protein